MFYSNRIKIFTGALRPGRCCLSDIKRLGISVLLFILFPCYLFSQGLSNLREKHIQIKSDTIQIDTLSIIPNTISITDSKGEKIDSTLYIADYANARIIFSGGFWRAGKDSMVSISYRVFPHLFTKSFNHKDIKYIEPGISGAVNPFIYTYDKTRSDIFKVGGLNKSGSISRGISFGSNQDVIVNSSLDLRLSGKLSDNINILAAITDDNIPIQPEGNTQQIQEFDKVFIQLYNEKSKLIAGDFELTRPESYFMNFYKKAQGASFTTLVKTGKTGDISSSTNTINPDKLTITTGAAISKGKYARNVSQGSRFNGTIQEGNQGPYKMRGSENELFIIILSGTEQVYIDGELLTRGQENDYVIDYNTAEITFTPKRLITKDKRIVVEFQYSDKNYTRSLLFAGSKFEKNKLKLKLNVYSEQDAKNQPLFQEINSEQKQFLDSIGDDIPEAYYPSVKNIGYNPDLVLYQKIDTTVFTTFDTVTYKDVFVYSTDSNNAIYSLGFSNVGQGNGNYIKINSTANGRVFEWIAPDSITKQPQGVYEPVVLLITPKKKQMVTLGGDYVFSERTKMSFELAASNNDINTFSDKGRNDDAGYAFKVNFQNIFPLGKSEENIWQLKSIVSYEQVDKNFSPVERYRSVEFERDWNLGNVTQDNEYISALDLSLTNKKLGTINYRFKSFVKGYDYNAYKNLAKFNLNKSGFQVIFDGSLLQTTTKTSQSQFVRSKASIIKKVKWFSAGIRQEQERNVFTDIASDTLKSNSFEYYEWGAFVTNADTAVNKFKLSFSERTDMLPVNNRFEKATVADNVKFSVQFLKNPRSRFRGNITYRKLIITDPAISTNKPDESLLSRVEYTFRLFKGAITSSTFYEIGSGLESKKEFSYIEVAPGQGIYVYIGDLDSNGVFDLNEFEKAAFQYQANYIKVYTPTNEYIKTFSNLFNEALYIKPSVVWRNKGVVKNFIARFSNQTTYRIDRKTTNKELLSSYNPFFAEPDDSTLVTLNSSFRNTLYFNRTNPKFGIDLNYQDIKNKALLINDTTSRVNTVKGIRFRWNMSRKFTANLIYNLGEKKNTSELFPSKDYTISYYEIEPKLTYQPGVSFRISLFFNIKSKENKLLKFTTDTLITNITGGETSIHQKIGTEIKQNVLSKGSLLLKVNYINITYKNADGSDASQNNSLSFEMLEGLQSGQNITWNLSYQRSISKHMQLRITYDGRKSEGINAIHTGGVQLRAFF